MILVYFVSTITGLLFGVTESINKSITEKKFSSFAYSFVQNFFNFLIYLIPSIYFFKLPATAITYLYLILATFVMLAGNVLLIKAYKTEDVSNVSIMSESSLIISFLMGIIFLSEPYSYLGVIGIILISIGIITIMYEGKKLNPSVGL